MDYSPVFAVPINVGKKIVVLVQLDIEEASGSPDNIEPVLLIVFVLRPTDVHFVDAANNRVPRSILLSQSLVFFILLIPFGPFLDSCGRVDHIVVLA